MARQPGIDYSNINFDDGAGNYGHMEVTADGLTKWVDAGVPPPANAPTTSDFYSWAVPKESFGKGLMDFAGNAAQWLGPIALGAYGLSSLAGGAGAGLGAEAGATGAADAAGGLASNPFAYTPTNPYSLGFDPGAFTASQLPGGALSGAIPAGAGGVAGNPFGLLDMGGAGAVPGAGLGGGGLSLPNLPTGGLGTGGGTGTGSPTAGYDSAPTAPPGTGTGAGGGGAAGALGRIMDGTATNADYLSVLGTGGATALGLYGSNQQANSLQNLAAQYQNYGAPSRGRFEASMTPGFDPTSIPGYSGALDTASKSILAKLSAQGGNPYGSPGGLIEANKAIVSGTALPAIQEYQRMNANTGFGNSMNAAMNLQTQGVGADANSLNALGYGLNALTNPQPSLQDLLKQIQGLSFQQNTGLT